VRLIHVDEGDVVASAIRTAEEDEPEPAAGAEHGGGPVPPSTVLASDELDENLAGEEAIEDTLLDEDAEEDEA
jgi:hypothetical protein